MPRVSDISQISYSMALAIGIFQVLALIPGTSRSGATILGAILIGTSRTVAAEFTFYLAIPVMFGASLLKILKFGFHFTGPELAVLLTGSGVAFFVSILAIKFLIRYIKRHDFLVFPALLISMGTSIFNRTVPIRGLSMIRKKNWIRLSLRRLFPLIRRPDYPV